MRPFLSRQTVLFLIAITAVPLVLPVTSALADTSCPRPANRPTKGAGKEISPRITLKPETAGEVINFGGTRGTRSVDVVLLASRPLPKEFTVKQLELDSPKRFRRTGQTLDSASLRLPRFSNPQIIEHRKKIRLRICVDTTDAPAGAYSGQVFISGPPGITGTSVTLTVNAKTTTSFFFLFLILALVVAFFLLLFKAAKEEKEKREAKNPPETPKWREVIFPRFKDPLFLVSTAIALVAALVAMRGIYDSNPAWGTETWTNVFALCGTAFGAAGVGSLITAFTPKAK